MKRLSWMLALAIASGCAADVDAPKDQHGDRAEPQALGGLALALTSVDSQGRAYRLRNATFTIVPDYYWYSDAGSAQTTVLSTEDDPTADRLTVRLVPNSYLVTLGGAWYIERLTPTGPERVQQVVLLDGGETQYAYVNQDWNSEVHYRFGVDGTLLDFRHGDLSIAIDIELPGDRPADAGSPFPSVDASFPSVRDAGVILPFPID
jgi:hypothetical protein